MTKEKANQFLKETTGRRIRLIYWSKDWYVVPTGKIDKAYTNPHYWRFECIKQDNKKRWYYICEGFLEDAHGDRWEYVENFEVYLESLDL